MNRLRLGEQDKPNENPRKAGGLTQSNADRVMKGTPEDRVTVGYGLEVTRSPWEAEMVEHLYRGVGECLEGENQEMLHAGIPAGRSRVCTAW